MPGADNSQRELINRISNMAVPRLGRADVPESLELALSTAMAKSPQSRYSSAHAFALALQRIQAELNLSVTSFEVLEEPQQEDNHPDEGLEETRVRSIAAIDPERTGSAPTFPARTRPQTPDAGGSSGEAGSRTDAPPSRFTPPAAGTWPPVAAPGMAAQPQVPASLLSKGPADDGSRQEWAHSTVLRGNAGSGSTTYGSPVQAADAAHTGAADATVQRPVTVDEQPIVPARDHGKRNLWLAISGGTLLALAAVVGLVVANAAPDTPKAVETQQAGKPPADALDNGTVPDVAALNGVVDAQGKATFTWENPQPKDGDTYKWRVYSVGESSEYQSTAGMHVQIALNPDEPTCVQVMIVRRDGAFSPMEDDSIACIKQ
jgi:hypothetical protein